MFSAADFATAMSISVSDSGFMFCLAGLVSGSFTVYVMLTAID